MKKTLSILFLCFLSMGSCNAALVYFNDRNSFEGASGLTGVNDDFESIAVASGGVLGIADPFVGAGFSASSSGGNGMVALGAGLIGNPSKSIGPDFFADFAIFTFLPGVEALGIELFSNASNDTFNINIFAPGGALLGNTSVAGIGGAGTFFGVITDTGSIGRIEFTGSSGEIFDNITLGDVVVDVGSVPLPSAIWLFGFGVFSLLKVRKHKLS